MLVLARLEAFRLLISPLAWIILGLSQALLAYLFFSHMEYYWFVEADLAWMPTAPGVTELVVMPWFYNCAVLLLLTSPILTMRSLAEERRHGTMTLLLASPQASHAIVWGKFLGLVAFFGLWIALMALMPLTLLWYTPLDLGLLAAGWIALLCLSATLSALGIWLSSLTAQPLIAAVMTYTLTVFLWVLDWSTHIQTSQVDDLLRWFALQPHIAELLAGRVRIHDALYFLLLILLTLTLAARHLDYERRS